MGSLCDYALAVEPCTLSSSRLDAGGVFQNRPSGDQYSVGGELGDESVPIAEFAPESRGRKRTAPVDSGRTLACAVRAGRCDHLVAQSAGLGEGPPRRVPGNSLMIHICNFHVLNHLLLIYICKLHWNLNTMFVCQRVSREFRSAGKLL